MKNPTWLLLISCCIYLSSCFDIVEKISFTATGSGSYTLIFNGSKSKSKLNSIQQMKSINNHKVPTTTEINAKIAEIKKYFTQQKGISNVTVKTDYKSYIFSFSCNFTQINNLNSVIANLKKNKILGSDLYSDIYHYDTQKKIFSKKYNGNLKTKYNNMPIADREIFSGASFLAVVQFPSTVKSVDNKNYIISESKKAVKFQSAILDIINQKKNINTSIQLQ